MPKSYTTTVFNGPIEGTAVINTDPSLNEMLGRADYLVVQVKVVGAVTGTTNVVVNYEHSNNNVDWKLATATPLVNAPVAGGANEIASTGDARLAAYGRFEISLTGATPGASVEVIACGRTE